MLYKSTALHYRNVGSNSTVLSSSFVLSFSNALSNSNVIYHSTVLAKDKIKRKEGLTHIYRPILNVLFMFLHTFLALHSSDKYMGGKGRENKRQKKQKKLRD